MPSQFPTIHLTDSAKGQALPRERRVRRRQDYLLIQSEGVRVTTEHFVFLMTPTLPTAPSGVTTRLGITATRRIGGAVVRNRAKRLVREAFRRLQSKLPAGTDIVVIVRKPLERQSAETIIAQWKSVLGLLQKRSRRWSSP